VPAAAPRLAAALLVLSAAAARAQDAPPPKTLYVRTHSFRLPLRLDARTRAGLREIQLHVRRPPDGWRLHEAAPPDRTAFEFRAPRDGDYWFRFVLTDRDGNEAPGRIDQEAETLQVVVDTQPPEVDVHPVPVASGQVFLQCNIRDAHPDYASVRLEYQLADGRWRPLAPVSGSPGLFVLPDERILAGRVRASAADLAGNRVTREIDLGQTAAERAR
jgi:hypothetical protein